MSKEFDTVNIHKLINKLMHTIIPNTITKCIANYIKGRKAYKLLETLHLHTANLKTGVPQGMVLSSTLFNIYISDISTLPKHTQPVTYADNLKITATHFNKEVYIQKYTYNYTVYTYTASMLGSSQTTLTQTKRLVHSSLLILQNKTLKLNQHYTRQQHYTRHGNTFLNIVSHP